jgi:CDP-diacylglycerol pyrophosphatase
MGASECGTHIHQGNDELRRLAFWISIACLAAIIGWVTLRPDPDALLTIMQKSCLAVDGPSPCVKVARTQGYVIMKDRHGSAHFLLLPTALLTGIESSALGDANTPNYFALAWDNRGALSTGRQAPIADDDILLAINSKYGRSQNQLHIHIACIDPEVKHRIELAGMAIGENWGPLTGSLAGHRYWARRVTPAQFDGLGAFRLLLSDMPQARGAMAKFSIAITRAHTGDFIVLATERDLFALNLASAEELQDENCIGFQ